MREINEESNADEPLFKPRLTKEERPETILEVEDSGACARAVCLSVRGSFMNYWHSAQEAQLVVCSQIKLSSTHK